MTLTVVVGSSGSGKTTLLEDVHKLHKCCYIRQYHMLRPYVKVESIPNFDPTALPYWSLYSEKTFEDGKQNVSYSPSVQIGGTMAGQFTKGLSGGQRKMLLFELVKQRTAGSSDLLLVLDEPFAGVTDDFVPFIVMRLNEMRQKHNILLVTNDHVQTLTEMADSTVVVSAVDRSKVCVDSKGYDRELFLHAVASGAEYEGGVGSQDLRFFAATELSPRNPNIQGVLGFTAFAMVMFLLTFWDSREGSEALLLVGLQIVAFFAINPYLIHLTDWRNTMAEEAAALMHVSAQANLALKAGIVLSLMLLISSVSFGMVQACTDTLRSGRWFVFMLFDSASLELPFICFGLYSSLPLQVVQILASFPFLLMIFFSTTFSPGAGVAGVKSLRYLFSRFYFWCALEAHSKELVEDEDDIFLSMEGCPPEDDLLTYAVLSGCLGAFLFLMLQLLLKAVGRSRQAKAELKHVRHAERASYFELQTKLYGADKADEYRESTMAKGKRLGSQGRNLDEMDRSKGRTVQTGDAPVPPV